MLNAISYLLMPIRFSDPVEQNWYSVEVSMSCLTKVTECDISMKLLTEQYCVECRYAKQARPVTARSLLATQSKQWCTLISP